MNAIPLENAPPAAEHSDSAIVDYYTEAGSDYAAWSTRWNMHFGFARRPSDVLHRERMLENMNDAVLDRVLGSAARDRVIDLGCGLGATMRSGAARHPDCSFEGVTLVDWQVEHGRCLNAAANVGDAVRIRKADYLDLPHDDDSFDGAYALESACYAPGLSKEALISEAARVLRPGAKFVIADGFRIDGGRPFSAAGRWLYRLLCDSWAITDLAEHSQFVDALARHGFEDIRVEDYSWRVAWSVMWVPWVTLKFLWGAARRGEVVSGWRAANVVGSVATMVLGLMRWRFRYLVVSASYSAETQGDAGLAFESDS